MRNLQDIKASLQKSDADQVLFDTATFIEHCTDREELAEAYYLRGNAFRQKNEWGNAMNCYLSAIDYNPNSPAVEAYHTAQQILDFFNKDFYNP